jgi:hypothetical protein
MIIDESHEYGVRFGARTNGLQLGDLTWSLPQHHDMIKPRMASCYKYSEALNSPNIYMTAIKTQ